jgi:hypothetical protein
MGLGKLLALLQKSARFRFLISTLLPCFASMFAYPEHDTSGSVVRFLPNLDVKLLDDSGAGISSYDLQGELGRRLRWDIWGAQERRISLEMSIFALAMYYIAQTRQGNSIL